MTIYATFFESSTHATCLLREAERLVGHLSIPLKQKVLLFKALVSLRTAQWDQAALALDQGLRLARRVNDVATTAHLTNNLACLSLEQGQWNEAITLCRRCIELDETISGGGHLAVAPLVNMANAYFYQGKARRARQLYDQALEVAAASGYSPLLLEVHACLGLVALQEGDQLKAEDHARELSACLDETNGVHERFKIEWLRAYMDYGLGTRAASDLLRQAAEEERSRDIVGALKLAWLERLLYANVESGWPGDTRSVAVAAEMRSIGLGWFSGFTRRWLKTARSRSTSTCSE
ncbi:MAG: tetratricopeptide repeat protein [Gemmatimonadales bacterium]